MGEAEKEARNELESGHRAGAALEYYGQPMDRARFLAIRESFMQEWEPRGGIEQSLIDMMAQSYTAHLYWLGLLHQRSVTEGKREKEDLEQSKRWKLPFVKEHEAVEQAAAMADRFHRLFIRNLRALRDLRRYMPNVTIQNVGQLNIAAEGGQQVNLTKGKGAKAGQGKRRSKARQILSDE